MADVSINPTARLNLPQGALRRLDEYASHAGDLQSAFRALPKEVSSANREMVRLGQTQARLNHLSGRERAAVKKHMSDLERHHTRIAREVDRLDGASGVSGRAIYADLQRSGNLGDKDARRAAGLREDHYNAIRQQLALDETMRFHRGLGDGMGAGSAAKHYLHRGLLGTGEDGRTPRSFGAWAKDNVRRAGSAALQSTRTIADMLLDVSVPKIVAGSMNDVQEYLEGMHTVGTMTAGTFEHLGAVLRKSREDWKFSRTELLPVMKMLGYFSGQTGTGLTYPAARFARATGLGVGEVAEHYGRASLYGKVTGRNVERGLNLAGMGNRPGQYLNIYSAAQQALGAGNIAVADGQAQLWAATITRTMGDTYMGPRGADMVGRMISGVRARGNDTIFGEKLAAIQGLDPINLGTDDKPMWANPQEWWGAQLMLGSGNLKVMNAVRDYYMERFGSGHMGQMRFGQAFEGHLSPHESSYFYRYGKKLTDKDLEGEDDLTMRAALAKFTEWVESFVTPTLKLEGSREEFGLKHVDVVMTDAKKIMAEIATRMASIDSVGDSFKEVLAAWNNVSTLLTNADPRTQMLVGAQQLAGSNDLGEFGGKMLGIFGPGVVNQMYRDGSITREEFDTLVNQLKESGIEVSVPQAPPTTTPQHVPGR